MLTKTPRLMNLYSAAPLSRLILLVSMVLVVVGPSVPASAQQDLVAHWTFDETSGTTASDSVGSNDGTLQGDATWDTDGKYGGSLLLDGTGDHVLVASGPDVNVTKNYTLSAWVKPDVMSRNHTVLSKVTGNADKQYEIQALWDGRTRFKYEINNTDQTGDFGDTGTPGTLVKADGTWQHMVVTVDNSLLFTVYLDGQVLGTKQGTNEVTAGTDALHIGLRGGTYQDTGFQGRIDDVRIYDRALSASEVLDLYNGTGSGGDPEVTIAATDSDAGEPSNNGTFTLTATPAPSSALSVNLTVGGTATAGSDYTAISTPVTIPVSGTATVTLDVQDDLDIEGDETVSLTVASGSGYAVGTANNASITIADDDSGGPTTPVITVAATDSDAGEPSNNGEFTLTATPAPSSALSVSIALNGATNGSDYQTISTTQVIPVGGTLTIPAWSKTTYCPKARSSCS